MPARKHFNKKWLLCATMSLCIASLNSGSNGNCYYIGNDQEAVLVDVGISCREVEKRMRNLGLSLSIVKAIFISHEHGDHIRGVEVLSKRYQLPVYITPATLRSGGMSLEPKQVLPLQSHEPVMIGQLQVTAFSKSHDAADPVSFVISCSSDNIHIGVFTDIGHVCAQVIHYFGQCHAAFLEANYDEQMLEEGRYPYHLKNRIRGGQGHLSNRQALELFIAHRSSSMSHLLLAHLSQDNNHPELVLQLFKQHADNIQVAVASRYVETGIYRIVDVMGEARSLDRMVSAMVAPVRNSGRRKALVNAAGQPKVVQCSLF
jgi:phosphoribosyl 1,2-cyclic phosphodiesterase